MKNGKRSVENNKDRNENEEGNKREKMIKTEFKKQNRKKEKEFRTGSKNKRMYNPVSERI